jgi:hypothetical protein
VAKDLILHVFMGWTNFRQALTGFRVRTDDDSDPLVSPDYDSGSLTLYSGVLRLGLNEDFPDGLHLYHRAVLPAGTDVRYVRIDLTDGAHPDGFFEASRLAIAIENTKAVAGETDQFATGMPIPNTVWTPGRSAAFGSGIPSEEEVEDGERAEGGGWWPYERENPASVPYRFGGLKRSEIRELRSLYASRGTSKDVVSIMDYNEAAQEHVQENLVHGFIREFKTPTWRTGIDGAHETSFEIESIL